MHFSIVLYSLINIQVISSINNPKRTVEQPLSIVEYYNIDTNLYMFFSERVTWDEAEIICPNYDAQLAVVNTPYKANKLAAAMGESNIEMEDMWIGGQRSDNGVWAWLNQIRISLEPSHGFPPWVRKPDRPSKECVALHRIEIDQPLFVDLDCRLSKPFICQRGSDAPGNLDIALPSHTIQYEKSTYILYHSRVAWGTAAAFCRIRGYRLAVIPNNEVAKIVSTAMIRSRPSFENVWLGGHFYHNKWTWVSTGETMPSSPNGNNYPPWHHNSTDETSGCILLDRHVCNDPVFLAFSCEHKRDFVCEKYTESKALQKKVKSKKIVHKGLKMLLVLKELSWTEAQDYCRSEHSYLAEVSDYDNLKVITTGMSDQESEPTHVWLGGRLINDTWTWTKSNKSIPTGSNNYNMPWCDMEQKEDDDCLNLDREAHDKPVVYGLNCDMKQPFVCTQEKTIGRRPVCEETTLQLRHGNSNFVVLFAPSSYEFTSEECKKVGGKLADVQQEDVGDLITKIINITDDACKEINFWIHSVLKCPQLNMQTKTIDNAANCSKQQGFICQPVCAAPETADTKWKCKGRSRLRCKAACEDDSVLIGPDTLTCANSYWIFNKLKNTFLPHCQSHRLATDDIIDVIRNAADKNSGLLFIVDESYSVTTTDWQLQMQFVENIIRIFPLSTNWTMGLILFSSTVRVPVPYGITGTCKIVETISKLTPSSERDFTFIHDALVEANNQINKFNADLPTIIIYIGDGDDNGEDYEEILNTLKKRNLIISIGINTETLTDLNKLASNKGGRILMYNFQKFSSFKQAMIDLTIHRSKDLQCSSNVSSLSNNTNNPTKMKVKKRQYITTNETLCDDNPVSIELKGITFTTFLLRLTYADAKLHCVDKGGRLAYIKKNQLEVIINSLVNKLNNCNVLDEEFWINRRRLPCITLHIGQRRINNCSNDGSTTHGFICETVSIAGCSEPPTDNEYVYNSWNCEMQGKLKNCSVKCKDKAVMAGTSIMICNADGWVTSNNQSTHFPICLANEVFGVKFVTQIRKLKEEHDGFLFLFDNIHNQNKQNGTVRQLDLMKVILEIFPPSDNFPVGLILLDGNTRVPIPYNETSFCLMRRKLHHLKHTPTTYQSADRENSYSKALMEVENQISIMQPTRKTLIFFVSGLANSASNYTNILAKLKAKHTMFCIGNNYDVLRDLNGIASMNDGNLLMYTFKSYEDLDYTMKIIKQHYGQHYKCAGDM